MTLRTFGRVGCPRPTGRTHAQLAVEAARLAPPPEVIDLKRLAMGTDCIRSLKEMKYDKCHIRIGSCSRAVYWPLVAEPPFVRKYFDTASVRQRT